MLPDNPDNIDDLFRQQLGGHATPPSPNLWARLPLPTAEADPVDIAFQTGLRGYASPPRRELWERLEDEYLRPQPRRRVVAWWQLSAAAVLLLMLLAGGGLLWRSRYTGGAGSSVAHQRPGTTPLPASRPAHSAIAPAGVAESVTQTPDLVAATSPNATVREKNQKISSTQATAPLAATSSTPIATTTRPRRPATAAQAAGSHRSLLRQQPDAATGNLAATGRRKIPAGQSLPASPTTPTPAVTPQPSSNDTPVLATVPAAAPAATPEIIEVEVRRGPTRPAPAAVVAVADPAPATTARRRGLRLGGLLHQADRLVHGESVSLADATGLPETVTLQARLGGRVVSKTIQL